MISIDSTEARAVSSLEASNEMTKHGITCAPVDYFHFGSFRYTNVKDAVAEAKRRQIPKDSEQVIGPESSDDMLQFGITCVPVDYFYYRSFQYTNLKDAIAAAKRDETRHENVAAS